MNIKKKIYIIFFIVSGLLLFLHFLYPIITEEDKIYIESGDSTVKKFQAFGDDGQFLFLDFDDSTHNEEIFRNYLIISNYKQLDIELDNNKQAFQLNKNEFYDLYVYDLNDKEHSPKMIDLLEIANKNEKYTYRRLANFSGTRFFYTRNKSYFCETFTTIENGKIEEKLLTIDLGSGQLSQVLHSEIQANHLDNLDFSWGEVKQQLTTKIQENYRLEISIENQQIDFQENANVEKSNFEEIYSGEIGSYSKNSVIYGRQDRISDSEWFDNLLHWFAPKGQDVLEIYATNEETGEKTQIKSAAEYEAWLQTYPPYLEWKAESEQKGNQ